MTTHPGCDATCPDTSAHRALTRPFAEPEPCACWSCDGQCGGTDAPGSCGTLADVDGHPICAADRAKAQVFDEQRAGVSVRVDQEKVRLTPDVFGLSRTNLWLSARSARHLAAELVRTARELEDGNA